MLVGLDLPDNAKQIFSTIFRGKNPHQPKQKADEGHQSHIFLTKITLQFLNTYFAYFTLSSTVQRLLKKSKSRNKQGWEIM